MSDIVQRLVSLVTSSPAGVAGLPPPAQALTLCAMAGPFGRTIVCVTDGPQTQETMLTDSSTFGSMFGIAPVSYPAWENLPGSDEDDRIAANRMGLAWRIASGDAPRIIVTCVQALLQKTPTPAWLRHHTLSLAVGSDCDLNRVSESLQAVGYRFAQDVVETGQAALRGGILDFWNPSDSWPHRIECVGSRIESIRRFNPADQRSVERREAALALPASEWTVLAGGAEADVLHAFLPVGAVLVWSDPESIASYSNVAETLANERNAAGTIVPYLDVRRAIERNGIRTLAFANAGEGVAVDHDVTPVLPATHLPGGTPFQPDLAEQGRRRLMGELVAAADAGSEVHLYFDTPGSLERFKEYGPDHRFSLRCGRLSGGFASRSLRLVVVSEGDWFGHRKHTRRRAAEPVTAETGRDVADRVSALSQLEPGDLVVHVEHGIGRFLGAGEIAVGETTQEVLTVEYAEEARLHIPVSQAHLLSRYVGLSGRSAELHRLGGRRWSNEREAAEKAVLDLASSLLETQAAREVLKGYAYGPDTPWQREFEATFPYVETPDQTRAIEDAKADMRAVQPMDRLICGDAGYGKTEVAMRAAFKAVMEQRQVAMLVPTTVLAQQHYETFSERMAPFPVRIEMLSRFCTHGQRVRTLKGLTDGSVDVVIGTHALLQPGIRFKDLGLVIVDEEQRFGVADKERLKQLRRLVDVLTLTATPIPRTLYMSLTGARDMSLLQTPPRERLAVETVVARATDAVIREAILRELSREGQVFFLHNRILTLDRVHERLANLVPEARIVAAHGQMRASELAAIMRDFVAGEYDVLLSTTIIESGLDIPRANTILIDRADRFGLADLYQLRGRVGRSNHKAYAYLLLPAHGALESEARHRVAALRKYSGLGAGFHLAMRDLELRGAGNLLGSAQSGHIAAVGFGLYCQLLRRTIERLKGADPAPLVETELALDFLRFAPRDTSSGAATIPYAYVDDEGTRLEVYREVAGNATPASLSTLRDSLRDRFGPIPQPVERLLQVALLRIEASRRGIRRIETRDDRILVTHRGDLVRVDGRFPRFRSADCDARIRELLTLVRRAGK
jgi:transcription-repair coupling factor (superfamily II helicase)